jgi:hypothetical protein
MNLFTAQVEDTHCPSEPHSFFSQSEERSTQPTSTIAATITATNTTFLLIKTPLRPFLFDLLRNPAGILPIHTDKPIKKPKIGIIAKKANVSKATQRIISLWSIL